MERWWTSLKKKGENLLLRRRGSCFKAAAVELPHQVNLKSIEVYSKSSTSFSPPDWAVNLPGIRALDSDF